MKNHLPNDRIDPNYVRRLYWSDEFSARKIADQLNTSYGSIFYLMKKFKIPTRHLHNRPIGTPHDRILAYLAGVLAGDGHLGKNHFILQTIDKDFAQNTYDKLKSFSEPTLRSNFRRDKNKLIYSTSLNRKSFIPVIQKIKFNELSRQGMIEFINGFTDSEGCVMRNRMQGRYGGSISISNNNTELLKEISIFLKALNIPNKIYKSRTVYEIIITRKSAIKQFHRFFHFSIYRKQLRLNALVSENPTNHGDHR